MADAKADDQPADDVWDEEREEEEFRKALKSMKESLHVLMWQLGHYAGTFIMAAIWA